MEKKKNKFTFCVYVKHKKHGTNGTLKKIVVEKRRFVYQTEAGAYDKKKERNANQIFLGWMCTHFPINFLKNEKMIYLLDKSQNVGYLNGIFMIIFFDLLAVVVVAFFDLYAFDMASDGLISFHLLWRGVNTT